MGGESSHSQDSNDILDRISSHATNKVIKTAKMENWNDLTSCCQENKVPDSCLGHCIVDYSNGYRKLTADDEKTVNMGLCKDHSGVIKECQKRGFPISTEWCTDIQGEEESYSCKDICKQLGQRLCSGNLAHYTYKEQASADTDKPKKCCCLSNCVGPNAVEKTKNRELINELIRKEIVDSERGKKVLLKDKKSDAHRNNGSRIKVVRSKEKIDQNDKKNRAKENRMVEKSDKSKNQKRNKDNGSIPKTKRRSIEDTKESEENHTEAGKDYQLHEELKKPRKNFRKISRKPFKDLKRNIKHDHHDKRSLERIHHQGGTEYAGGEFDEEMIHGKVHWED